MRISDWGSDVCSSDLPGGYAEGQVYNIYFRERAARPARAADAVRAVFSRGGACYDCHTVTPPAAGQGWQVEAVHQTPRFLGKGWLDHDSSEERRVGKEHIISWTSCWSP